jgi:hypothetical protein
MKDRIDPWIRGLLIANAVVIVLLLGLVAYGAIGSTPGHPAQGTPEASASGSPDLMTMGLAHIPTNSACVLCHDSGGSAALKVIPALGHPLEGWRQCLTCHTNQDLGLKAPGHDGIQETECLNCHKEAVPGPAITQPHSQLQDQHCLDCHGNFVHLPTSMASKSEDSCTYCHKPTPLPPPQYPHIAGENLDCRACHQSPQVGGLPVDHALRDDSTCLLCHTIKTTATSGSPAAPAPASPTSPTGSSPTPFRTLVPSPTAGASSAAAGSP